MLMLEQRNILIIERLLNDVSKEKICNEFGINLSEVNNIFYKYKIKLLRDKTSASLMHCKRAINECDGDINEAIEWLKNHSEYIRYI